MIGPVGDGKQETCREVEDCMLPRARLAMKVSKVQQENEKRGDASLMLQSSVICLVFEKLAQVSGGHTYTG